MKLILKNTNIKAILSHTINKENNTRELRKFPMLKYENKTFQTYFPIYRLNVIENGSDLFSLYVKENETFVVYNTKNNTTTKKECSINELKTIFGLEELVEENNNEIDF